MNEKKKKKRCSFFFWSVAVSNIYSVEWWICAVQVNLGMAHTGKPISYYTWLDIAMRTNYHLLFRLWRRSKWRASTAIERRAHRLADGYVFCGTGNARVTHNGSQYCTMYCNQLLGIVSFSLFFLFSRSLLLTQRRIPVIDNQISICWRFFSHCLAE